MPRALIQYEDVVLPVYIYIYSKSHCGDKTILRPSYLHNGISYTGKMTSLNWIGAQVLKHQSGSSVPTVLIRYTFHWTYFMQKCNIGCGNGIFHLIQEWRMHLRQNAGTFRWQCECQSSAMQPWWAGPCAVSLTRTITCSNLPCHSLQF